MLQKAVKSPLFRTVSVDELELLFMTCHWQLKTFAKDAQIAMRGDVLHGIYILLEGSVRGEMIDFEGRVLKIEDIEAPRPLAPAFLFGINNTYPVHISANTTTKAMYLSKESLLQLLQKDRRILMNYLDIISVRAQFLTDKIKFLSLHNIRGKLAQYLLDLKPHNMEFEMPHSQTKLADLFGVSRPALARVIREMHQEGIIHAKGRHIRIINHQALSDYLR